MVECRYLLHICINGSFMEDLFMNGEKSESVHSVPSLTEVLHELIIVSAD